MADQTLPLDQNGVMSPEDIKALLTQTRQQLVAQYPSLANNWQFNDELNQAFGKFATQGVQRGSDYNALYNQLIAPFAGKWSAMGTQQTGQIDLQANQVARRTGSPTAAIQMFPQLLSPGSPYRANWQSRLAQEDKLAAMNRISPQEKAILAGKQAAYAEALKNDDQQKADELEKQIENFKPALAPSGGATILPLNPGTNPGAVAHSYQGVAAPMGTSGFVNADPTLNPTPHIYEGPALSPQAEAAMLAQWAPSGAATMGADTPSDMTAAPVGAPALARPAPLAPRAVTQENSGLLGTAISRVKNAVANSPTMEVFLHREDPAHLRNYAAAHPELTPDEKGYLLHFAGEDERTPTLHPLQNMATTGQLIKDALVGTSEAALPVPGAGKAQNNPVKPASKDEAMALPSGTWIQDPAGNIFQKQ